MVAVLEHEFFLSEILGRKVYLKSSRLGRLGDLVIVESGKVPEVSHLVVTRSFGHPPLLIPWDKLVLVSNNEIVVDVENPSDYEKPPSASMILLKDHILDKKILDIDDHEVEVVYDVRLEYQNGKLYASKVDFSRNALLRRIGLKALARYTSEHSENSMVSWAYVQPLPEHIGSFSGNIKLSVLKENIHEIHPVDLADPRRQLRAVREVPSLLLLERRLREVHQRAGVDVDVPVAGGDRLLRQAADGRDLGLGVGGVLLRVDLVVVALDEQRPDEALLHGRGRDQYPRARSPATRRPAPGRGRQRPLLPGPVGRVASSGQTQLSRRLRPRRGHDGLPRPLPGVELGSRPGPPHDRRLPVRQSGHRAKLLLARA